MPQRKKTQGKTAGSTRKTAPRKRSTTSKKKPAPKKAKAVLTDESFLIELTEDIKRELRKAAKNGGTVTLRIKGVGSVRVPATVSLSVDPIY